MCSASLQRINIHLCSVHGICFCQECIASYKENQFTNFNNACCHAEAQCLHADNEEMTQLDQVGFILLYIDFLEREKRMDVD